MDSFFNKEMQVQVLIEQYKNHGKIIVAFDFDDTVNPFRGSSCEQVIELIRELRPHAHLICFTARSIEEMGFVEQTLTDNDIPYDYINKEYDGSEIAGKKLFYNQLLDDKAGLYESYMILKNFLSIVKNKRAFITLEM